MLKRSSASEVHRLLAAALPSPDRSAACSACCTVQSEEKAAATLVRPAAPGRCCRRSETAGLRLSQRPVSKMVTQRDGSTARYPPEIAASGQCEQTLDSSVEVASVGSSWVPQPARQVLIPPAMFPDGCGTLDPRMRAVLVAMRLLVLLPGRQGAAPSRQDDAAQQCTNEHGGDVIGRFAQRASCGEADLSTGTPWIAASCRLMAAVASERAAAHRDCRRVRNRPGCWRAPTCHRAVATRLWTACDGAVLPVRSPDGHGLGGHIPVERCRCSPTTT